MSKKSEKETVLFTEEEIKEIAKVSTKELEIKAAALFEKFVSSLSKT